jgi:tetratricopeptide (TPR) repeat protein
MAPVVEAPKPRRKELPENVTAEIGALAGRKSPRVKEAMAEATHAYERGRYGDALRTLRPLLEEFPDLGPARELMGLTCYRERKWADAVRHLTRFNELTASVDQHPVLADAHRALRQYSDVQRLWDELAAESPSAELVAEGRIVMAGALADQGKLADAISLIERAPLKTKRPKLHHLRLWYVLGDLYERAGDMPRAKDRFMAIFAADPAFADVQGRLGALGR